LENASGYLNKQGTRGPKKMPFTEQEIKSFLLTLLLILGKHGSNLTDFTRSTKLPGGLTVHRFDNIRTHLSVNVAKISALWTDFFLEWVKTPGTLTLDETMWAWDSDNKYVFYIPRKPCKSGLRVQNLCFRFSRSGKPFSIGCVPEVGRPAACASDADDWVQKIISHLPPTAVTEDSWYGSWDRAVSRLFSYSTMALSSNQAQEIMEVLCHNLPGQHYRTFRYKHILVTVFLDAGLVRTLSTCYEVGSIIHSPLPSPAPSVADLMGLSPRLSESDTVKLSGLSLEGLQNLSTMLGLPHSMLYLFAYNNVM
jgi:hypothetical protein